LSERRERESVSRVNEILKTEQEPERESFFYDLIRVREV
jgi:hypothetical protein